MNEISIEIDPPITAGHEVTASIPGVLGEPGEFDEYMGKIDDLQRLALARSRHPELTIGNRDDIPQDCWVVRVTVETEAEYHARRGGPVCSEWSWHRTMQFEEA